MTVHASPRPPDVRGLLVDIDGTLLDGERPVPGAPEAMARFAAAGMRIRLLTNTSRRGRAATGAALRAAGFAIDDDAILTPARLARRMILDDGAGRAALFVTPDARRDLEGIADERTSPAWVVLGDLGSGFTHETLSEAMRLVRAGARLVALHRSTWWTPPEGRPVLDVGAYVAALEAATGTSALLVGKPARPFFALAIEEIGLPPAEVAVVGDDADADAGGAIAAGCRAVLVLTGKYRAGHPVPEGVRIVGSIAELG
jgi:HAD superfamily hydrolase (TIGR01458 family)